MKRGLLKSLMRGQSLSSSPGFGSNGGILGYGLGYGSVAVLDTITHLCQSVSFVTFAGEILEFMRVA
jgi:hypothetical protein